MLTIILLPLVAYKLSNYKITDKYNTMKITDIIRGILDQVDATVGQQEQPQEPEVVLAVPAEEPCAACGSCPCACEQEQGTDLVAIIQQLAGLTAEPEYANEPVEVVAPLQAAFPAGDDMHHSKNPADIRTNAPSMYPGYQAGAR
jgi:hypothetical protein